MLQPPPSALLIPAHDLLTLDLDRNVYRSTLLKKKIRFCITLSISSIQLAALPQDNKQCSHISYRKYIPNTIGILIAIGFHQINKAHQNSSHHLSLIKENNALVY